ncbi:MULTISPECIES: GDP-mannose mannosyl hydrolase [unclassified Herbaspirillum]|uniref:GDP-mannose mannosyl hydrolase n=1 Tax=unclassified Herbaspirillum TaxID=2624150 RepID=UPI00114FDB98|nr:MULTISPECIES: NUDIX domain-containing protein [unclassified Herbaspirillum]MBB5390873.1 colanic acid biosynthesis protein WcaH [Herbaspirillum sp. SJZ102]TQK06397.1 colanic acid biosynthesis protein WcaH [Herbaspirillum sp. SJZ130]TQK12125.1 colanic acid biosynthesis protein WcaH [Herbaspirillum sp. SJZ106]
MNLSADDFALVIQSTPLVSIDLLVRNERNEILLGYRRNRPASDCWFVPGGRIRKGETLKDAVRRIARVELGVEPASWELSGAFDHIYADNALGREGFGSHYVALGCHCSLPPGSRIVPDAQHSELRWWPLDKLMQSPLVHVNTKRYFEDAPANKL